VDAGLWSHRGWVQLITGTIDHESIARGLKATKAAHKVLHDFGTVMNDFLNRISAVVKENNITNELTYNGEFLTPQMPIH